MSKGFNFSLEKVLEIRQYQENKQALKLHNSKKVLKTEEQKLDTLKDNKKSTINHQKNKTVKDYTININELRITQDYLNQLNTYIEQQNKRVRDSDAAVRGELQRLKEAVKDKKIVEKLKERYLDEFKKSKNLQENKMQDEIAIRQQNKSRKDND